MFYLDKKDKKIYNYMRIKKERRTPLKKDELTVCEKDYTQKEDSNYSEKSLNVQQESYYHDITVPDERSDSDRYYEIFSTDKPKRRIWSVLSLIFATVSVICCFFGWIGLIFGALAVACSLVSRYNLRYFDMISIMGLIVGIFGIVFSGACISWSLIFGEDFFERFFTSNF